MKLASPVASEWKPFVRVFLGSVFCALALVGALNYVVNPDGTYRLRVVPQLLWGARAQKLSLLAAAHPAPQALILGSSRVMNLAPADLQRATGLVAFNAGVDVGRPEDFYVLLRYAVERLHLRPRLIVIGVDIEAFHNHEPPHYYLEQPTELTPFLWTQPNPHWRWGKFTKLFTYDETRTSLLALYRIASGHRDLIARTDSDGLTHWDGWDRQIASGNLELGPSIRDTISRFAPRYDDYTGVSAQRLEYLRATLDIAHQIGSQAIIFVTPTHPLVEAGLQPHGYASRKAEVLAALQNISEQTKTPFYDFSSPQEFGGEVSHFIDGVHHDGTFYELMDARMFPARARAIQ